ncbi:hypothetical protein MRX96_014354 [Rhipicephalus microplus]
MDRREALCRHLSESESSLEMDEERHFNEMAHGMRPRTVSSPIPYNPSPNSSRPLSPGLPHRHLHSLLPSPSPPTVNMLPPHPASFPSSNQARVRTSSQERFSKGPASATPVVSPVAPGHLSITTNLAPPTVPAAASPMMD